MTTDASLPASRPMVNFADELVDPEPEVRHGRRGRIAVSTAAAAAIVIGIVAISLLSRDGDTEPDSASVAVVDSSPASPVTTVPVVTAPIETDPPAAGDVAESKAVVRGGRIHLEGAVPTAEDGAAIAALAAEILGPDNVFNNDAIGPRAGDPNLGNITVEDTIELATGSTLRPSMTLLVVGHTDDRGSDEYNRNCPSTGWMPFATGSSSAASTARGSPRRAPVRPSRSRRTTPRRRSAQPSDPVSPREHPGLSRRPPGPRDRCSSEPDRRECLTAGVEILTLSRNPLIRLVEPSSESG